MTEARMQHEIVKWFNNTYVQYQALLFEVNNDTYDIKHRMTRQSMGMITGVADLAFIVPDVGFYVGIELKAMNSRHKIEHIRNQIEWGKIVIANGGGYLISNEIDTVKMYIERLIKDGLPNRELERGCIAEVEEKIIAAEKRGVRNIMFD